MIYLEFVDGDGNKTYRCTELTLSEVEKLYPDFSITTCDESAYQNNATVSPPNASSGHIN